MEPRALSSLLWWCCVLAIGCAVVFAFAAGKRFAGEFLLAAAWNIGNLWALAGVVYALTGNAPWPRKMLWMTLKGSILLGGAAVIVCCGATRVVPFLLGFNLVFMVLIADAVRRLVRDSAQKLPREGLG